MPRNRRINLPGIIFHVVTRGNEKRNIFLDSQDYFKFIDKLDKVLEELGHLNFAWALMPNHYHLLIKTSEASLSKFLQKLNTSYAIYFNKKYDRVGYLFQNRPKTILCQEENYFLGLIRYIHLNPLKHGLVKEYHELVNYPWTGHSYIIKNKKISWMQKEAILNEFSLDHKIAKQKYEAFIYEGIKTIKEDDFSGGGLVRSYGGWQELVKTENKDDRWNSDERILGDSDFVTNVLNAYEQEFSQKQKFKMQGWTLEKIMQKVCYEYDIPRGTIKSKGRSNQQSIARSVIAYLAYAKLGIASKEICEKLNITKSGLSRLIVKGKEAEGDVVELLT